MDEDKLGGRRKDGKPFKHGNTRYDGSYGVGRDRPPTATRFAVGDGRTRGRRAKGVRNADTDFQEELRRKTKVREGGRERSVSKSRAVDVRVIDNAMKGQHQAIEHVDKRRQRIEERQQQAQRRHTLDDDTLLRAYLKQRSDEFAIPPDMLGDDPAESDEVADED